MKNILVLLSAAIFFFSCKKEETPPLLRIPVTNLLFSVDPTFQPSFEYYIPINQVRTNALNLLNARGIDTADIKSIRPGRATLTVIFAQADLGFIEAMSVRICPLGQDQQNCGQEVFWRDPTPFNPGIDLDLVPSAVKDIRDFVLRDEINVQVVLERLRGFPNGSFDIVLDMDFEVR